MANDFKIKNGLQLGGALTENVGTISGNADIDLSTGNVFDYTPTADATFAFSNVGETEHSFVLSVMGANVDQGYDLANAAYDSVSFSVSSQEATPTGLFFKREGDKFYLLGGGGILHEYNLSASWDVSTASFVQSLSLTSQETNPQEVFFKPDGTAMYIAGNTGDDINQYSLTAAWDISTASFVQNFSVAPQETTPTGLFFKADGSILYVVGISSVSINQYSLSTAWDISTASYIQSFSVSANETSPRDLFFSVTGLYVYVLGATGDDVNEYSLSTAWDISTASYVRNFSIAGQETSPQGLSFKTDGTKMYVVGSANDTIYQYSTAGTPAPATFTYPASVAWPAGTAPTAPAVGETDILEFSTSDGGTTWYGVKAGDAMA